ncbi:cytochrome oxidase assembly [gamma proteobacterium NOR5-3]|nr:cytochrome oxidase assembly [gamma proteobacterium NOR5-3]
MFSRAYQKHHDRQLALWLLCCAVVIYGMILLGGVTRLTESGLSMVEWRPIMGIWPPIGEAAWQEVFAKYQRFPEYQKINQGMGLDEFKVIFMYEYLHRVLGRLIGLLFVIPLLFFALRGCIRPGLMPRLLLLLVLGGCQGLLGWYMVKSGLVDRPSVSQYRLTAHLGLAVALYAAIFWQFLNLWPRATGPTKPVSGYTMTGLAKWSPLLIGLVYLMILSGGLVAGTDAGYSYPTWPNMGPGFIPPGLYEGTPQWLAAFEDVTTIQFNHRMFAYLLVIVVGGFALRLLLQTSDGFLRLTGAAVMAALLLQVTLGISTLLTRMAIPVAAGHQAGAILLLTVLLFTVHALRRRQGLIPSDS